MRKQISMGVFIFILVLLTFLPRLLSLSTHWSSDETRWMRRSRSFVFALERGRFADTFTAYHPGVTTTWLGGAAILNAYGKKSLVDAWMHPKQFLSPSMLAHLRFPIAALTGVLILFAGILLCRLLGAHIAAVGTLFLALEPLLLAESRRIHTDALTSVFLFLSLLFWLCYLEGKILQQRNLVFSGICFGLACLTKSHAGMFLLFLPFLLFWYVKHRRLPATKMLMSILFFFSLTMLTVLSVWPYLWTITLGNLWISPLLFLGCIGMLLWSGKKLSTQVSFTRSELLALGCGLLLVAGLLCYSANYVFARMYEAVTNAHELPKLFLGVIRYDPGPLYYPVMLLVWSAPLTMLLTVLSIYHAWRRRHQDKKIFRITVALILFGLFYLIGLSLVAKKIDRYLVIFLPVMSCLAAMGAIYVTQYFSKKYLRYLCLIVVIVLQIGPVLRLHPYYTTYYYPLLSGQWITKNISIGYGAGLDVAADYLNAKMDAQHIKVRVSRFSTKLSHYFVGKTKERNHNTAIPHNIDFDYDVEYIRGVQIQGTSVDAPPERGMSSSAFQLTGSLIRDLEHVVRLNQVDYVWIYRVLGARSDPPAETQ